MERQNPAFTILIADDDEDDCLLVEIAFRKVGIAHELRFVGDGRELLDYLYNKGNFADPERHPRPNLILLDLNMPKIDGREALATIKSDRQLRDIPVLILTTSKEERDIAFSKEAGAASFLTKSGIFDDWTDILSKFCAAIQHNPSIPFEVIGC